MREVIPGLALTVLIMVVAKVAAGVIPLGSVTIAILLGILIRNVFTLPGYCSPGIRFSEKQVLPAAIALLGFGLDYRILLELGAGTIVIILLGVPFTILAALLVGRILGMDRDLSLLLGVGNAVCGSSAIAAAQAVIQADGEKVGVSVAAVNLFGTIGLFLLPGVCLLLTGFSPEQGGILIGDTLQSIGQVTAAGYSIDETVGRVATVVKMGRVLLITPVVLVLGAWKGSAQGGRGVGLPKIPRYLVGFILFSGVNSLGILPGEVTAFLHQASKVLLTVAMAGIGMAISKEILAQGGKKVILTGLLTWILQIAFSLFLVHVLT